MYKKQMKMQKILCFALLCICAVIFIYALGIMTDLYDALYNTIRNAEKLDKTTVTGSRVYYDMQPFNRAFLYVAIGLIVLVVLLFITNTQSRRRYYIGNYAATGLFSAAGLAAAVWSHIQIEFYKAQFLGINFEELAAHAAKKKSLYTESTFWFDIHYVLFGLLCAGILLLIFNAVWKARLMRDEQALIREGEKLQ